MNGVVRQLEFGLRDVMESLDRDIEVRVIVLTGAGRAFCAGMDMEQVGGLDKSNIRLLSYMRPIDMNSRPDFQTRYSYFSGIRKPVIAAINGAAASLGLVLALYADVRFASKKAVLVTAFAQRGLIPERGIAWILPRIVGQSQSNALHLLLTSRKTNAAEALKMRLVNRVLDGDKLLPHAMAYTTTISESVLLRSTRIMKRQVWESSFQTHAEAINSANEETWHSLRQSDFVEGVAHFVETCKPNFTECWVSSQLTDKGGKIDPGFKPNLRVTTPMAHTEFERCGIRTKQFEQFLEEVIAPEHQTIDVHPTLWGKRRAPLLSKVESPSADARHNTVATLRVQCPLRWEQHGASAMGATCETDFIRGLANMSFGSRKGTKRVRRRTLYAADRIDRPERRCRIAPEQLTRALGLLAPTT